MHADIDASLRRQNMYSRSNLIDKRAFEVSITLNNAEDGEAEESFVQCGVISILENLCMGFRVSVH